MTTLNNEVRPLPAEPDAHGKVCLLLHTAVHRSHLAGCAVREGDPAGCSAAVLSALQIVDTLHGALDPKVGELSQQLQYLYAYIGLRLIEGNETQDPRPLDEATRLLAEIASGWSSIPVGQREVSALAA